MTTYINADLHCHSVISDGTLTPQELAHRARNQGVELWALTDHDEVRGQHDAAKAAKAHGMHYVSGVEISVTFLGQTVHILGLGFDVNNTALIEGLTKTRSGRRQRAIEMGEGLAKVGIQDAYLGALQFVNNPDLISRTHFARFLVQSGVCKDTSEVFRKYLTQGKPGFVAHSWATLKNAVTWIVNAGGVAVIAHPARYCFTPNEELALFIEFTGHGGQGLEVATSSHSAQECRIYAEKAREFGLAASRGSDFHSPTESHTELGKAPPLPNTLTPVWELLASKIQT